MGIISIILEWFNQDASYNSCLYEFKESAEFILISDWDDVLVPKLIKTMLMSLIGWVKCIQTQLLLSFSDSKLVYIRVRVSRYHKKHTF